MAIAEELIAGVVSSVLAVLLVEVYLWLRKRYRNRSLRFLVGSETCSVVTPIYPWAERAHPSGMLTTYDAIGLAHVLEACSRVGTVPVVGRSGEVAENSPLDLIAIGGPSGNRITASFLRSYCPGFEILDSDGNQYYRCGGHEFVHTAEESFAFLTRLSPRETGLPGSATLVWGHSALATASAGYYLARYADQLRKASKGGSFFVAVSVRPVLGYRSFDTRPVDLTKAALAPPVGGAASASVTAKHRATTNVTPDVVPGAAVPEPPGESTGARRSDASISAAASGRSRSSADVGEAPGSVLEADPDATPSTPDDPTTPTTSSRRRKPR